jgi:SanA protein
MTKGKKIIIIFGIVILTAVIFITAVNLYIDNYAKGHYFADINKLPAAEAVMVLGALVRGDGTPSPVLRDRLDRALDVYNAGKAGKILVSGDNHRDGYDEVNPMRDYLLARGVPPGDIIMDHFGINTYDSMYRAKYVFGIESLIISTQYFHIRRAVYIARKMGIDAVGYPSEDRHLNTIRYLKAREVLAKVKAFIDTDVISRRARYSEI